MTVNGIRLLVLSALAKGGPMHGYQIRRVAKLNHADLWIDIKPGSLYHALHKMTGDGLVEVVRTEREGATPERTVYTITEGGHRELIAQRDRGLQDVRLPFDPLDLVLAYSPGLCGRQLADALHARRKALADTLANLQEEWQRAHGHFVTLKVVGLPTLGDALARGVGLARRLN